MKNILQKLGQLEETAPKAKKILNEDSATPPVNVSDKPSTLRDVFETMAAGQKPIPVVGKEGSTQQTGAGFLNITDPALQGLGKALGDLAAQKKIQMVVPTQPGQQPGQQPTGQAGQPNQAGATGQPQAGQMQMKEKDEGKPGKNFAKIAKSAGKRYGSKEAGERVAGAVRAKLAKQGKLEEEQIDELSPETMKSYKNKAFADRKSQISKTLDKLNPQDERDAAMHRQGKRAKGMFNADKKLGTFKDPNWGKGDDNAWIKRDAQAGVTEGAKVDRMVKHIAKSERELGKSKDKAEDIAWATANKRGMLDNKNKKKVKESAETEYRVLGTYDAKTSKGYDTRPVSVKIKAASEKEAKELAKQKLAHNHKNYKATKVETLSKKVEEADIPSSQGIDTRGAGLGAGRSATTLESKKPDFLDLDKDGNKKESMKKAAADKKKQKVKESMNHRISAARLEGKSHGLKGHAHCGKNFEDLEERKAYCDGYKDGLDECYGMGVYEAAPAMPAATVGGMAHDEMGEGNAFTRGLARTPRGGQFKVAGKTFTDRTGYDSPLGETDFAFEAWDRELNSLLTENETVSEGLSVSITKGQQNAPDSVTITAQDAEADQLLAIVKQAGLGLFGGEEEPSHSSAMSIQPVDGEPTEIGAGSTDLEVVDGSDGMLSLMKKLGGIQGAGAGEEESEEDSEEHTCNECGMMEAECGCSHGKDKVEEEETEDQMEFEVSENAPDSGAEDSIADEEAEADEDADLAGADSDDEEEMNESFFDLLGRLSKLTESSDEEDEEDVTESEEDEEDVAEDLTEWANNAGKKGTDASFEQDIEFMTKVIAGGLNKPKSTGQTTVPVIAGQADRMQDHQGSVSDSVDDWKKLAGLK